jgi:hypothetical protein
MGKLYDHTIRLSQTPEVRSSSVAIVSIHYGDGWHKTEGSSDHAWFIRKTPSPEDVAQSVKRSVDNDSCLISQDSIVNKRRKIRASRQTDVSSLLGLLGST